MNESLNMQTPDTRLNELFQRWYNHEANETEKLELFDSLEKAEGRLPEMMKQAWEQLQADPMFTNEQKERMLTRILGHKSSGAKIITLRRVAAAASIILVLGAGSYFLFFNKAEKKNEIVKTHDSIPHDVAAPKGTKAMITFDDGRTVALDSVGSGMLAMQGDLKVMKNENGEIVYNGSSRVIEYNTIINPRGSKVVPITLVDGTKAWLNADASLKYFTSNAGNVRRVEITGEAYFEVAHNPAKPFIVKDVSRATEVEVLGTHFNINTYDDEPEMKVTLLEGSVRVLRGTVVSILKPGQQAQVGQFIKVVSDVDINEVMSWKNGLFSFNQADLQTVMRQLSRWYGVDIVFEKNIPELYFEGKMERDLRLSQVLKILEKSQVHFRIEDVQGVKKIIVMP
jgi:ferric-dicitrate binding protein FerR (iron transport regulator)